MTSSNEPLLLLSGAGLPPWIWDDVRAKLPSHETVVAPRPSADGAGLDDYVETALQSAPWDRFTVVAHSSGGVVGTELARRAPDRVRALLAVSAVVPRPGGSVLTSLPFPQGRVLGLVMRVSGTRPPDRALRRGLAHGLDDATADRVVADFTPESVGLYRDRVSRGALAPRCGYVTTTRDPGMPPKLQHRFATALGASWERRLDTGHLPMLEDADRFARAVDAFLDEREPSVS